LEGDYFDNVLHVLSLSMDFLSIYQITHLGSRRKVEFYPDSVVILDLKIGSQIAHGVADHHSHLYSFSHFIPKSVCTKILNHTNDDMKVYRLPKTSIDSPFIERSVKFEACPLHAISNHPVGDLVDEKFEEGFDAHSSTSDDDDENFFGSDS